MGNDKGWKLIGGLFIAVSYLITAIALIIARLKGIVQWGDLFSLGQLIFDALVLPAAVIGFIVAIGELRKSLATPKLTLYWESKPGVFSQELVLPVQPTSSKGGRPVLLNEGSSVAVWYVINFDVPLQIYSAVNLRPEIQTKQWNIHVGINSDWRIDLFPEKMRVTFMSNGHVAAYPNYPLPLGILNFPSKMNSSQDTDYEIPYVIATDNGKPMSSILKVRFMTDEKP